MKRFFAGVGVLSVVLLGVDAAAQQPPREMSPEARPVPNDRGVFGPDPAYDTRYNPNAQIDIYGGKRAIDAPRPLFELGRPLYTEGPFTEGINYFGERNLVYPAFSAFGDWRNAIAFNDKGKAETGLLATRLNLDLNLQLTATERLHAFFRPLDRKGTATRMEFAGGDHDDFHKEFNLLPQTLFFEGDLGAIYSGFAGVPAPFDLPVTVGLIPLTFHNGIWVEDAFTGFAFGIPAKNSRAFDVSNMDITFFAGFDKVTTAAFKNADGKINDHAGRIYGVSTFIEANQGYWEAGFGRVDGSGRFSNLGYDSAAVSFTRRYGSWLSNSIRGIWTFGQEPDKGQAKTADGFILLLENSLVTRLPNTLVPYFNLFAGFDRPVPLARDEGGLLKNTGINFETDGMTAYPKLDDTGQRTFGGALGVSYLFNLDQQLVGEVATVQTMGNNRTRVAAKGDQYAIGLRYQIPLSLDWILRFDANHGFLDKANDFTAGRAELRWKF